MKTLPLVTLAVLLPVITPAYAQEVYDGSKPTTGKPIHRPDNAWRSTDSDSRNPHKP